MKWMLLRITQRTFARRWGINSGSVRADNSGWFVATICFWFVRFLGNSIGTVFFRGLGMKIKKLKQIIVMRNTGAFLATRLPLKQLSHQV